jgi:nucleotide-binding universal stress UspA family protein
MASSRGSSSWRPTTSTRAIPGVARRIGAETIVVGASRPDGLAAPLGVCQGVLPHAPVPVVVVRPSAV